MTVEVKGQNRSHNLLLTALGCALLLVLSACDARGPSAMRGGAGDFRTAAAPSALPVEVMAVTRGDIQRTYRTVTTLEAGLEAEVVARSTGVLETIRVEEGDYVEQGQVLAQLDIEQLQLEVAQREATVARLRGDLQRTRTLFERNLGSATDVDNLRYELQSQEAQLDLAELRLRYATVTAPISGIVTERLVKVGNMIQTNQVMFRLTDPDSIEAVLHLPQRELSLVAPGQPVWLQMDAFPGQRMSGQVQRVRPQIDVDTGTFRVTAVMDNPDRLLMAGMFGRTEIVFDTHEDVLLVSERAVISRDNQSWVFVVRDDVAVRVSVETGVRQGGLVEVLSGLRENELVVTTGQQILEDGASVDIVRG